MPFAVTLRLDPVTASAIHEMWQALAAAGIDSDRHDLGYAPHVTFAIHPDDAPPDRLRAAVVRFATEWAALPISLSGLVVFPHPAATLWAAPVVTPALLARQAELHAALHDLPIHPHYRPDAWVPHVTLSGALADPGAALTAVLKLWRPLNGWLDRLDLVRFRPVQILQSHALPQ